MDTTGGPRKVVVAVIWLLGVTQSTSTGFENNECKINRLPDTEVPPSLNYGFQNSQLLGWVRPEKDNSYLNLVFADENVKPEDIQTRITLHKPDQWHEITIKQPPKDRGGNYTVSIPSLNQHWMSGTQSFIRRKVHVSSQPPGVLWSTCSPADIRGMVGQVNLPTDVTPPTCTPPPPADSPSQAPTPSSGETFEASTKPETHVIYFGVLAGVMLVVTVVACVYAFVTHRRYKRLVTKGGDERGKKAGPVYEKHIYEEWDEQWQSRTQKESPRARVTDRCPRPSSAHDSENSLYGQL